LIPAKNIEIRQDKKLGRTQGGGGHAIVRKTGQGGFTRDNRLTEWNGGGRGDGRDGRGKRGNEKRPGESNLWANGLRKRRRQLVL